MRTDAIIDKRQVRCKNSSYSGFSKSRAQVGDLIFFTLGDRERIARMIGRIHYAPNLSATEKPIKDYILAVMLGTELGHLAEFWINPDDVTRVLPMDSANRAATVACFLSDDLIQSPIEEVRQCASEGWSTLDAYRAYQAKQKADLEEYLNRKGGK